MPWVITYHLTTMQLLYDSIKISQDYMINVIKYVLSLIIQCPLEIYVIVKASRVYVISYGSLKPE